MTKIAKLFDVSLLIIFILFVFIILYSHFYLAEHEILSVLMILLGTIGIVAIIYGAFIEPNIIKTKNVKINLATKEKNTKPIKIVMLTDLGIGTFKYDEFLKRVVNITNKTNPDFVILNGDVVDGDIDSIKQLDPLKNLKSKYSKIFVIGNHDYDYPRFPNDKEKGPNLKLAETLTKYLEEYGFEVLINQSRTFEVKGRKVEFVGVDDWLKDKEAYKRIGPSKGKHHKILLSHNPDIVSRRDYISQYDLILSGHTHGGQIRLPIIGPILPQHEELIDRRRYGKGLSTVSDSTKLYVSSGLGESHIRIRLFNFPQIEVIEI